MKSCCCRVVLYCINLENGKKDYEASCTILSISHQLKSFCGYKKLSVSVDPTNLFLKTMLNEGQVQKACVDYGAVLV